MRPYPDRFTFIKDVMGPNTVKLTADQLRSPKGAKVWEEAGFIFQRTERPHPDQPYDAFFNPTFFILTKPGGEEFTWSPEAAEIKDRLFEALSWTTPNLSNHRAWKEHSQVHSEIAEWFWSTAAKKDLERMNPNDHVAEIAEKLLEIANRSDRGRWIYSKAIREGLERAAGVLADRRPAQEAKEGPMRTFWTVTEGAYGGTRPLHPTKHLDEEYAKAETARLLLKAAAELKTYSKSKQMATKAGYDPDFPKDARKTARRIENLVEKGHAWEAYAEFWDYFEHRSPMGISDVIRIWVEPDPREFLDPAWREESL